MNGYTLNSSAPLALAAFCAGAAGVFAEIAPPAGESRPDKSRLTYELTADLRLDAGVNVGVTESADAVNPFVGMSWRF